MTTLTQSSTRKLSLLQMAEEPGRVSTACKIAGYHRDTYYWGALKGVGTVYVQVVVDVSSRPRSG